uniref:Uncharacterized protein n=1 Tax=Arundo donax TaxID=35708 RepID=A0A0A9DRS2_ARUDO
MGETSKSPLPLVVTAVLPHPGGNLRTAETTLLLGGGFTADINHLLVLLLCTPFSFLFNSPPPALFTISLPSSSSTASSLTTLLLLPPPSTTNKPAPSPPFCAELPAPTIPQLSSTPAAGATTSTALFPS